MIVLVQKLWLQASSDGHAVERTRTLVVKPDTTIAEVVLWAATGDALQRGDVVITEEDRAGGTL